MKYKIYENQRFFTYVMSSSKRGFKSKKSKNNALGHSFKKYVILIEQTMESRLSIKWIAYFPF